MPLFATIALILILSRATTELGLSRLNQRHVRVHANEVPAAFRGTIDDATYCRSVDYTLAKSRFGDVAGVFDAVVLIAVLFSGVLPWAFWKIQRELRHFNVGHGWFSLHYSHRVEHPRIAVRLVRAIQTRRAIRF
jgi:hypothetical protein